MKLLPGPSVKRFRSFRELLSRPPQREKCHLIAPFSSNPQQWLRQEWTNVHSKRSFTLRPSQCRS